MSKRRVGLIDVKETLASNRNRLAVEAAELEDAIVKRLIVCGRCGRARADHDGVEHAFCGFAVTKLAKIKRALDLISQLTKVDD